MPMHIWEPLTYHGYIDQNGQAGGKSYTDRMEVPGGWLYRTYRFHFNHATESSVFVPSTLANNKC